MIPGQIRLYSGPLSMFGAKAEIALREKAIPFDLRMVPFDMERLYEPKHPDIVRINPKKQVPVLLDGEIEIFDSTQIFEYLEDRFPSPPLWPKDSAKRAKARLLELQSDEVFFPPIIKLMGLQDRLQDPAAIGAKEQSSQFYEKMETLLHHQPYLAGEYSFADIAFYMAQIFAERMAAGFGNQEYPLLRRWRDRMTNRAAVQAVIVPMVRFLTSKGRPIPDFLREFPSPDGFS